METEAQKGMNDAVRNRWIDLISLRWIGKSMHSIMDGTFLTKKKVTRALPFIFFLMFLGILYITNIFQVEKTKRQLDDLDEQLRELRYEYITSRSKLMKESKPSKISEKLVETGIKESTVPPQKIRIMEENKVGKP